MKLRLFRKLQRNDGLKAYYSEDDEGCQVVIMNEPGWVYDDLKVRPFDYLALDSMARDVESADFDNREEAIREAQAYLRTIGMFDEREPEFIPLEKRLFTVRYGGNPLELVFGHRPLSRESIPCGYDSIREIVHKKTGAEFDPAPVQVLEVGDHYSDPDGRFAIVRNMNRIQQRFDP